MKFVVLFEDHDEKSDLRSQHMSEHLAFLDRHAQAVRAAGPLRDGDSSSAAGGLWLVEAETLVAVQGLVEADPFWPTGLRKSVKVLEWRQVFADGRRLI